LLDLRDARLDPVLVARALRLQALREQGEEEDETRAESKAGRAPFRLPAAGAT
jgi:hypothetical protein